MQEISQSLESDVAEEDADAGGVASVQGTVLGLELLFIALIRRRNGKKKDPSEEGET